MPSKPQSLMWFRADLRVADNPALHLAMQNGPVLAVFCASEKQWQQHDISPAKKALLVAQVRDLADSLAQLNVPLLVLDCPLFADIPDALAALVKQHDIQQLYYNHEYEVNEMGLSRQVTKRMKSLGVAVRGEHDQVLTVPGSIRTGSGEFYKVFTAFKKALYKAAPDILRPYYTAPDAQQKVDMNSDLQALDNLDVDNSWLERWPAGEQLAQQQLQRFVHEAIRDYKKTRDFPAQDNTSRLSAYQAVGALSTMQCLRAALAENNGELDSGNEGIVTWINELIWRDFYRHLLVAYPDLCKHKAFKSDTDRLPWKHDEDKFQRWCEGNTGYPIVDAAMRQLNQTGWMHNRLRMIVAMFLTKHLFIDWRWGERYFMQKLVDGDLASNNGGWQWSASTGCDAVPYFRIFNPVTQSERFDPKGDFIRNYVPELAKFDAKKIHMPSADLAKRFGYPAPMVDHASAVAQTKAWFKELNASQQE